MDGVPSKMRPRIQNVLFLLAQALKTRKRVLIVGHPEYDIDLIATFKLVSALCWELGADSVEMVHRLSPQEVESPWLVNLGVKALLPEHLQDDPDRIVILVDCNELSFAFGPQKRYPKVDFVIDHHIPCPEFADRKFEYLIMPGMGCAALIAYNLLLAHHSMRQTDEGMNLILAAFATDNDLRSNDLLGDAEICPDLHPEAVRFCRKQFRDLFCRGRVELFFRIVERQWETPEFEEILRHALNYCVEIRISDLSIIGDLLGEADTLHSPENIGLVELPQLSCVNWVGKVAGTLLRGNPSRFIATLVRAPVGLQCITAVRSCSKLNACELIKRLEGGGGGRPTAAGYRRPLTERLPWSIPQSDNRGDLTTKVLRQIVQFLRKED